MCLLLTWFQTPLIKVCPKTALLIDHLRHQIIFFANFNSFSNLLILLPRSFYYLRPVELYVFTKICVDVVCGFEVFWRLRFSKISINFILVLSESHFLLPFFLKCVKPHWKDTVITKLSLWWTTFKLSRIIIYSLEINLRLY